MNELSRDLRLAFRGYRKAPALLLVIVLTLAIGIGANTAIFTLLDGVLLRPLPYPAPEQLVHATSSFPSMDFERFWISPPEYLEYREWNRSFADMGAYRTSSVSLAGDDRPQRVRSANVTASLFDTLAVAAERGRVFSAEEDVEGAASVAVLSSRLWRQSFGGDDGVIGSNVLIDGSPHTVVGVMPPGFDLDDSGVDVWLPMAFGPDVGQRRANHATFVIGRLRPEVSLDSARAELDLLLVDWRERAGGGHSPAPDNHPIALQPLHERVVGDTRPALMALLASVGFVLIIACVNVANLLLSRSDTRQREMALRTAMGASRWRLLRQLLTESVVVALIGGLLGIAFAHGALRAVLEAFPGSLPRTSELSIDGSVLLGSLLLTVFTGLAFGLLPALKLSTGKVGELLKEGGQRTGGVSGRARGALVITEVALAVALVAASVLMMRSVSALSEVDTGFEVAERSSFELFLPPATYPDAAAQIDFHRRLQQRLLEQPGIEAVGAASGLPPRRQLDANDMEFEGLEPTPDGPPLNIDYYQFADLGYLEAMGIQLVAGRAFRSTDDDQSVPAVLVNQKTAETFWPGQNPLGKRLRPFLPGGSVPWLSVVGVVEDVKQGGIEAETGTEVYFSYPQVASLFGPFLPRTMNVVVRSTLPAETFAGSLRSVVRDLDSSLPVAKLRSMETVVDESISRTRLLSVLLTSFGAVALFLAGIGLYGVLAYAVTERRREFGIRMSLGADRGNVLGLVFSRGLLWTLAGLTLGTVGTLFLTGFLQALLFGVSANDPWTFAAVAAALTLVAVIACLVPALRATRVDPIEVLRYE